MKLGKFIRRFVAYPLLVVSGCFTLLTGSPIPTWHLESLNSPVTVEAIKQDGLLLEDGRTVKLPLVKRLPADDPLMLAAIEHGVELADDGKIFGLLSMTRTCGNDSCVWNRRRVNLASLAAILLPDNIDESTVRPEVIAVILDRDSWSAPDVRPRRYDDGRINVDDAVRMHRIEEELDYSANQKKKRGDS